MYSLNKIIKTISPIAVTLACFGLSPQASAVCQEGCLTNDNTALGEDALLNNELSGNTAIGFAALFSLGSDGYDNTAVGDNALYHNKTLESTAVGAHALYSNDDGYGNTAVGVYALFSNTTGGGNTATGNRALAFNTTADGNTANGYTALYSNTTGSDNTALGDGAMFLNTTGNNNTATGWGTLKLNTTGNNNTAAGWSALVMNSTGNYNTATGVQALSSNTTGNFLTATGQGSLLSNTTGRNNTANGQNAMRSNTTGSFNVALGWEAGSSLTTGNNNIEIGNKGLAGEANTIRIGKQGAQIATYIAGISGVVVAGGVGVIVDSTGHLGTVVSSERFKDAVRPMDKASEAILSLKPVTFRYKTALDPKGIPQFGLVAEQVAKVNPDLVARDEEGKPYTVRYEAVNAMLLNEFLKEHRKVEELEATVAAQEKDFKSQISALAATLKAQAAQIRKVSDQLGAQARAPRVVAND